MAEKNKKEQVKKPFFWIFFAIVSLLFNILLSSYYYYGHFLKKPSEFQKKYRFLDVSRGLLTDSQVIGTLEPLRKDLREMAESYGNDKIGIYVEYLNTGMNISINQDLRVLPASLAKLPLAMAAVKKIEKGDWQWDSELVLMDQDRDKRSGQEFNGAIGTRFTIESAVKNMLVDSDNTMFNMLIRNMENRDVEDLVDRLGLDQLFAENGEITAKEYSRLFRSLYVANYLSVENSNKMLEWLSKATFHGYLSQGFPSTMDFPHKFGENVEDQVYLDSGILYVPGRSVLVTVTIKGKGENPGESARELMKQIGQKTYAYIAAAK